MTDREIILESQLEIAEQKLQEVTAELMRYAKRNVHIEINGEHNSESMKISTNFSKTIKK